MMMGAYIGHDCTSFSWVLAPCAPPRGLPDAAPAPGRSVPRPGPPATARAPSAHGGQAWHESRTELDNNPCPLTWVHATHYIRISQSRNAAWKFCLLACPAEICRSAVSTACWSFTDAQDTHSVQVT